MDASMSVYSLKGKRVWVAGHRGMVGSALLRRLAQEECEVVVAGRRELDLRRQADVERVMAELKPHAVFIAAATVGGIFANDTRPAEFIFDNIQIAANLIDAAWKFNVEKLLYLGSSCIYPKHAPQPMTEGALLTGTLEPTNEWYAIAKIAGIKMCQAYRKQYGCNFIAAMPTNLYGPGDNYDLNSGHVIPALIRKAHEAKLRGDKQIVIWGTGTPRREFLHVDDCADALVLIMTQYSDPEHINVGSGEDLTIAEVTRMVCDAVGFEGDIERDLSKPDGTPRKLMSGEKLRSMGWRPRLGLKEGLADVYAKFVALQ
jgi:GDP-L-fucose synthase